MADNGDKDKTTDRRGALGMLVGVGSAAYAAALVIPGYRYLEGSRGSGGEAKERWARVARLEKLPDGKPERVKVIGESRDAFTVARGQTLGSVWLHRTGDTVRALSAECPH